MARKNKIFFVFATFLMVFNLIGCSSKNTENNNDLTTTSNMELIYEETISPNKEFAEKEEDIVNYTVEVYQDKDNVILVNSKSNSEFFKPLQYEFELDTNITKEDIDIEWTTLMGNPISTKDDQLGIPYNYSFLSAEQKFIVHDSFRQLIAQSREGKIHALQIATESSIRSQQEQSKKLVTGKLKEVAYQKIDEQTEALVSMIGNNQVDYRFFLGFKLMVTEEQLNLKNIKKSASMRL